MGGCALNKIKEKFKGFDHVGGIKSVFPKREGSIRWQSFHVFEALQDTMGQPVIIHVICKKRKLAG